MTHLGNLVKLAKQFIEHNDQLLGRAVGGQTSEAHDVSIKNTKSTISTIFNANAIMHQSSDVLNIL